MARGRPPWLYSHTVTLGPAGVVFCKVGAVPPPPPREPAKRGEIEGFSKKAAARLRRFLIEWHVPLSESGVCVSATYTVPGEVTPEEWRVALRRWSMVVKRAGCAAVWRVELQKRKQPHLHVLAYLPVGYGPQWAAVMEVETWLRCLPERCASHRFARRRALKTRVLSLGGRGWVSGDDERKWLAYVASHATKHKREQLGWKGKQWGVVNRAAFVRRQGETVELTRGEAFQLRRWVRRLLRSKARPSKRRFVRVGLGGYSRVMDSAPVRRMCLELIRRRHALDDRGLRGTYAATIRPLPVRRGLADPASAPEAGARGRPGRRSRDRWA